MKGTITAWLRTGITAREGDIVTASMIYTRPPRQLTAKQAKRMREIRKIQRRKRLAKFDTIKICAPVTWADVVGNAVIAKGPIVPIGYKSQSPADAPLPTKPLTAG